MAIKAEAYTIGQTILIESSRCNYQPQRAPTLVKQASMQSYNTWSIEYCSQWLWTVSEKHW